jgi:hypothetical protein
VLGVETKFYRRYKMEKGAAKLFKMGELIQITKRPRRHIMTAIDALMLQPVKRDRDGARWFTEAQVRQLAERLTGTKGVKGGQESMGG